MKTQYHLFLYAGLVIFLVGEDSEVLAQEVYKWVGEDGQVHYSDQPAQNKAADVVEIPPGPDASRIEDAVKTEERIKEAGEKLTSEREKREEKRRKQAEALRRQQAEEEALKRELEAAAERERQRNNTGPSYGPWPWPHPPSQLPNRPRPEQPIANPPVVISPQPNGISTPSNGTSPPPPSFRSQ
ncbi:MAG: DUF4124 domain-containing protein [Gammaproteobacteria bacterium]|nr:DUF4124 domain-containing protein [Gammaproteobacteria bacterium]